MTFCGISTLMWLYALAFVYRLSALEISSFPDISRIKIIGHQI